MDLGAIATGLIGVTWSVWTWSRCGRGVEFVFARLLYRVGVVQREWLKLQFPHSRTKGLHVTLPVALKPFEDSRLRNKDQPERLTQPHFHDVAQPVRPSRHLCSTMQRLQRAGGRKAASPTAQLLRSSRLFSIPEPLPRPNMMRKNRDSPNATLPYPIHQAIDTQLSSLSRGDFGLKRPLPTRKLGNTSNPVIRVVELDTIEQLTDYEFAADHTQTLKKIQELNIAVDYSARPANATSGARRQLSAFDESVDNTSRQTQSSSLEPASSLKPTTTRWKYSNSEFMSQSEAQFQHFLKQRHEVKVGDTYQPLKGKALRQAFENYVRERYFKSKLAREKAKARDEGRDLDEANFTVPKEEYEALFATNRASLRREENFKDSQLATYIVDFLDLPPLGDKLAENKSHMEHSGTKLSINRPRTTHPSAGVSYLRSSATVYNHPLLGPQDKGIPVPGRILRQKNMTGYGKPTMGVAGIVANDLDSVQYISGVKVNANTPTGQKEWTHPVDMHVNRDGRLTLRVAVPDPAAASVMIKNGQKPPPKVATSYSNTSPRRPASTPRLDNLYTSRDPYGVSAAERPARSATVNALDELVSKSS